VRPAAGALGSAVRSPRWRSSSGRGAPLPQPPLSLPRPPSPLPPQPLPLPLPPLPPPLPPQPPPRFWCELGVPFFCQKYGFISPSTLPPGLLALQVNEASKPIRRLKQRRATSREGARTPHGPALSPVISCQWRARRKTRGHHAGQSQPRRRCSCRLLPTTKPAPRPSTRSHSAGQRTSRLRCRAAMHGDESRKHTTSPGSAAAAEIATPLKHRKRSRGKSWSGSASREAAATSS